MLGRRSTGGRRRRRSGGGGWFGGGWGRGDVAGAIDDDLCCVNADARGHGGVVDCRIEEGERGGRVLAFENAFHDLSKIMTDIVGPKIEFKRVQIRPGFLASLRSAQPF